MGKLTLSQKANEFKNQLLESLRMVDLEILQRDGLYINADEDMSQSDVEKLFESSDWCEGITAYVEEIVTYLGCNLTDEESEYINYLSNMEQ